MSCHDDPVRAGGIQVAQVGEGVRQLGGENERIHGHVPLHAVRVKETHQFRKGIQREVVCAQTGVETVQTEINGVCAIGYGGAGAVHVPGGSQQFGTQVSGPEGGKGHVVGSHGEKQRGCRGYWAVLRFSAWRSNAFKSPRRNREPAARAGNGEASAACSPSGSVE